MQLPRNAADPLSAARGPALDAVVSAPRASPPVQVMLVAESVIAQRVRGPFGAS